MFKRIAQVTRKRKESYINFASIEEQIKKALSNYLVQEFGNNISTEDLKWETDNQKGCLYIRASSKTLANEIKLSLNTLAKKLKEDKLKINTIIVQ